MKFIYPVQNNRVTCAFGIKAKAWKCGYHIGTDYSGNNIYCYSITDRGTVINVNGLKGTSYGNHVIIDYPELGIQVLYAHLDKIKVSKGQHVNVGTEIGLVGRTGTSAKHLHIEAHKGKWKYPKANENGSWLIDIDEYVKNKIKEQNMSNDKMTFEQAKSIIKTKVGLSDDTLKFLEMYKYGDDLIIKLAKGMK